MKKYLSFIFACMLMVSLFSGCGAADTAQTQSGTQIVLSDSGITVDGAAVSDDMAQAVYTANDIVYYEAGHDFTYGEGTEADAHTADEAAAHTVVHITQPGTYVLSGLLSKGQIAVDLGEDAEDDPEAVVTLVLSGVDITCQVAPAVIFYNVYECGDKDTAAKDVDTSKAGANVIIADGTENTVSGAYVARIYKPDSVELSEDGTEVADAKKLHKYDGAFYSKMSMNIDGGSQNSGVLNILATNEGLDSELHLTINGGNINIVSGNDGINTNEDGVSVTTVNGGSLRILVDGSTGEGDGIDSNGWLVINGGNVWTQACAFSGDAGIDSDMGIHINGGSVFATGNMLDQIAESQQNYAVFQFAQTQEAGRFTLKNQKEEVIAEQEVENRFMYLIISGEALTEGDYTLWQGDVQLQGMQSQNGGGMRPMGGNMEGMTPPDGMEQPDGMTPPEGMEMPEGMENPGEMTPPEGMEMPEGMEVPGEMTPPEGMEKPEGDVPGGRQDGQFGQGGNFAGGMDGALSDVFTITDGGNYFLVMQFAD